MRGGRVVHRFTVDEDALIVSLRQQGVGLTAIAQRASNEFGTNRSVHSIHVRLVMLAGREEDAA